MTTLREAATQALEALEYAQPSTSRQAIAALRAALAEPVQEPVVWECLAGGLRKLTQRQYDAQPDNIKRHYTRIAPQQRLPLTEKEAKAIAWVGPVYAPDGVVTRTPTAYRQELEQTRMNAIRRTEAAHGIGSKT